MTSQDFTNHPVPLSERRGGLIMALLWITMVTVFPNVLVGFEWYKLGMNLPEVAASLVTSCLIILAYSIPACFLGSTTGLTYSLLSRSIFGRWGSWFVSFNSIWVSTGWYALNAIFLAEGLRGLFSLNIDPLCFATVLAVLMAFNNFFGFKGVANFAGYLAAPVLVIWVLFVFCKASMNCPSAALIEATKVPPAHALTVVSSFVLGIACWGNEADYWRYGRPKWSASVLPLVISLLLGQILFPITGWMMARLFGVTEYAAATKLMNDYAFGGISLISATVLIISYVAVNDAGLYGAINAAQNLKEFPRKDCVTALTIAGALTTIALFGYKQNFEAVAALSCIFLPCSTVIMMAEAFVILPLFGRSTSELARVPEFSELPALRWPAVVSLAIGIAAGVLTSGFIPGTATWQIGIPPLQAWLISFLTYSAWRVVQCKLDGNLVSSQSSTLSRTTAPLAETITERTAD
ncbi:MAG: cytosine permease [Candidatus Obscuribacterales bacterium]|nr:cytosine permease [Candidatus Obscuribacterales bacterium]